MTDLDEVGLTLYNFRYPFPALKARRFVQLMEIKFYQKKQTIHKAFKRGLLVDKKS